MVVVQPGWVLRSWYFVLALTVLGCGSGGPDGDHNPDAGDSMDSGAGFGGSGGSGGSGGGNASGSGGNSGSDAGDAGCEDAGCHDAGPSCGNGVIDPSLGENCDDGDADSLDGCSASCEVESDYACDVPGQACSSTVVCGDGFVTGNELCDDHNTTAGDGCNASCQIESGWMCERAGIACQAAQCGDGLIRGFEACDDGDSIAGDGCDADCQLEANFACETPGQDCVAIVCGDSTAQGLEQCDDGNADTGDGCSPVCQLEPVCTGGICAAECGDGLKLPSEACDDGNQRDGDGCSAECAIEAGFTCDVIVENPRLPVVYRDFIGTDADGSNGNFGANTGPVHRDFQKYNGCEELVEDTLDVDGKPVLKTRGHAGTGSGNCVEDQTSSPSTFAQWYRSDDAINRTVIDELPFDPVDSNGDYYDPPSSAPPNPTRFGYQNTAFFPLTGLGWNAGSSPEEVTRDDNNSIARNFHFTSEVRYWFTYEGGERLQFFGDDDVWVFINGHLAVDISGVHSQRLRSVTLPASGATLGTTAGDGETFGFVDVGSGAGGLDIEVGGTYEVVVYQAERHTSRSQYQLTLENFLSAKSVCAPECGDGVVTRDEVCDDGTADNTGAYGHCNADCQGWGPRCGDSVIQDDEDEQCDNGINRSPYGTGTACAPGCQVPAFCGDGNVDSLFNEACDDGVNDGGYAECAAGCVLGPRCGDGTLQADDDEQCDDGGRQGGDGCDGNCHYEYPQ